MNTIFSFYFFYLLCLLPVTAPQKPASENMDMKTEIADIDIINRVLAGERQAYTLLVNRYRDYVFTLALRMTGGQRADAEDLSQEVFIKAFRFLRSFKGESKFSTWLYTIVHNTGISELRKKKKDTVEFDADRHETITGDRDSTLSDAGLERKSRQAGIQQAINRLSADDATVITLFYMQEQSLEEIGRILGIDANTAKVRLHRARTRLRGHLLHTV